MSGKEMSSRSAKKDEAGGSVSPDSLYKFEGQWYRLQRLDLSSLRAAALLLTTVSNTIKLALHDAPSKHLPFPANEFPHIFLYGGTLN